MNSTDAAVSPESGEAAALMSARHGWLRFRAAGGPLGRGLGDDVRDWQQAILADHRRWYGAEAPPQVSGAFVLQYLLQVPAHTAAFAAGIGMRCLHLADLTFAVGGNGVPNLVEIGAVAPLSGTLDDRLAEAQRDFRAVAAPLAENYRSTRRMSSRQRHGMAADMWAEAARAVRAAAGEFAVAEPRRISCCLIYALPGCSECSGCPRLNVSAGRP